MTRVEAINKSSDWKSRLRGLFIREEPVVPSSILGESAAPFCNLASGATVCVKVSCAYDLPYPFAVSAAFVATVVAEMYAANRHIKILLTEGGVGDRAMQAMSTRHRLDTVPNATFIDAEDSEAIFMPNPSPTPYRMDGFHLPACWVHADMRVLLTTCKLRSHHFQRWYSGGTRNLIGLLPRAQYKLSASKRDMRSEMHQRGVDAMVADLYATTGQGVLTILDARLLARQDEHLPIRFTRKVNKVLIAADPVAADEQMVELLDLPFTPPYIAMINKARSELDLPRPTDAG